MAEQSTPKGSSVWKPEGGIPPLALCMEEKEFNLALVQEKKKVRKATVVLWRLCF